MAEKVHFAIQLYDVDVTNKITSLDLLALLTALSECMDFFGDLKVPQNQIVTVVDGIFADYDQDSVGHINIADGTKIAAQSGIGSDIKKENSILQGSPAFEIRNYKMSYVKFRRLPELANQVDKLEKELENIKKRD